MKVEIWSDVVCPWCYIGKRHFELALAQFEARDQVEVVWRSFELDPAHPHDAGGSLPEALAAKYGSTVEQAQAMIDGMSERAARVGLRYDLGEAVPANTLDAHRLIHLAASHGLQDAAEERLFTAYMAEGADVGDRDTLVRLAGEIGLDAGEAAARLESGAFTDAVRADEREAGELGISGVPFFVIDRAYGISGAQPPEQILAGLRHAHEQSWAPAAAAGREDAA